MFQSGPGPEQTLRWLDGERAEALPLPDRGLEFGDGLFETLLYVQGKLLYLEYHMHRLATGLDVLGFPRGTAAVERQLADAVAELIQLGIYQAALRVTVTRGPGPRGYAPPPVQLPRVLISATPTGHDWRGAPAAATLGVATTRWATQPLLAGIKHLNRLEQVLAARERTVSAADEMLMLDQANRVVSVISGNIFARFGSTLVTPPLQDNGIRGTRRQLLIERWGPALGLAVDVRTIELDEFLLADEAFYTNALVGLRPVAALGERHWPTHSVCAALYACYCGEHE